MAKYTDLKCWSMVKISPEIINCLFFCPEKIKYYPDKKYVQIFEKITPTPPKKCAQLPSPASFFLCVAGETDGNGSSGELC